MTEPGIAVTSSGRRIHVDPGDPRAVGLVAAAGDLNPLSLRLWRRVLAAHAWDLVVDVGVNYGEMLVGVDLPSGARVVGFEPNARLRTFTERTLADNGLAVELRSEAVADAPGTARFAVDTTWSGTSSLDTGGLDEPDRWEWLDVEVTTLDAVVPADVASFCVKVDVEGFEREVVAGARSVLARPVPWVLMLEVLHMAEGYLAELAAAYAVLLMRRDDSLVRVGADDAYDVLAGGDVYPQDCLVVSEAALALLAG